MAALICTACSAVYSVGAEACPQCGQNAPVSDSEATPQQVREQLAAKNASAKPSKSAAKQADTPAT